MKRNGAASAAIADDQQQQHWSSQIKEVTVSAQITDAYLVLDLTGGADSGRFCTLSSVNEKRCVLWHGNLSPGSVILEVQGHKVSGFTLRDVRELVEKQTPNGAPIMIKSVPAGSLPTELRAFLGAKFNVDSADYALQSTIRDNLYLRTVPVTTRQRREHEIDGVDYRFLTVDQFLQMERSGQLLESGVYEGNRYGTPMPSADATGLFRGGAGTNGSSGGVVGRGVSADASIRRLRSQSSSEAVGAAGDADDPPTAGANGGRRDGAAATAAEAEDELLPEGWEKVVDPKYGVFYIDHVNKRTQYEKPSGATLPQSRSYTNGLAQHAATPAGVSIDVGNLHHFGPGPAPSTSQQQQQHAQHQFGQIRRDPVFTANPTRLAGDTQTVKLIKSTTGLGFTIVGGGERGRPEFLQVKSLVPGGPAFLDGRLSSGDVLVYVNETLVLGYTHEDVIDLFRRVEPGQSVAVTVCKGYRLAVSASDPRAEVVTKVAVGNGGEVAVLAASQRSSQSSSLGSPSQLPPASASVGRAELIKAVICRSSAGFGFTIADSPQGQRVRQILDDVRCRGLQIDDLLIEVNARRVKEMAHSDVARILSECPIGQECTFLLQRGSLPPPGHQQHQQFRPSASHSGGLAAFADPLATGPVAGFGHSSFLPPTVSGGSIASNHSSSGGTAASSTAASASAGHFFRHAPLRSSRPDTTSQVTVTAYAPPQPLPPPPASSSYSSSAAAAAVGTVPRFRSRTPGPESTLAEAPEPPTAPARPRTPTGLVEGRPALLNKSTPSLMLMQQQQHHQSQLPPQPPSSSAASTSSASSSQLQAGGGYGSLGRRPKPAPAPQFSVTLVRNHLGLGIRILGGAEEASQVTIGQLVPGSAAHADGRIRPGDEIVSVNGAACVGASHHRVVQLLETAGPRVTLGLRRSPVALVGAASAPAAYPYDVTVTRHRDEGFGFVIVSSVTRPGGGGGVQVGEFIGHVIDGSPASRCERLRKGDRILAVNGTDVAGMHHEDIVRLVRDSGLRVRLTVGPPLTGGQAAGGAAAAPPAGLIGRAVAAAAAQQLPAQPSPSPAADSPGLFEAVLHKTAKGFGFSIRGGAEFNQMPFYVLRIAEGGGAHQSGRLRVGDEIVSINDRPLAGTTHTEAIQVIRSAGATLKLLCRRPMSLPAGGPPPPQLPPFSGYVDD